MWWTTEGERVLRGAEWVAFRLGLSCLWDETEASGEEEQDGTTGVAVFDRLRKSECLALLAQVARGLHDEGAPCPDLTALTEGTIAAVFAHLRYLIEVAWTRRRAMGPSIGRLFASDGPRLRGSACRVLRVLPRPDRLPGPRE
jgi:hypothetical protein